jgi:CBS domain containing-hemolysin-like protein
LVWIDLEDDQKTIIEEITQKRVFAYSVAWRFGITLWGILDIKDLVGVDLYSPDFHLEDYLKEPLFIPENLPALKAFEKYPQHADSPSIGYR